MTKCNTFARLSSLLTHQPLVIYKLFCYFAAEFQIYSVMTETKKAFKDWDISDFDFAHAESLADQPIRRDHIPFYGFNKVPKGARRPQFPQHYPTSNLADVL